MTETRTEASSQNRIADQMAEAKRRLDAAVEMAQRDGPPEPALRSLVAPFTAGIGYHDGVFVAIEDANGQRVADMRDIGDAARLIVSLNSLPTGAPMLSDTP